MSVVKNLQLQAIWLIVQECVQANIKETPIVQASIKETPKLRITGPLWGKPIGRRRIPVTKGH